MAPEFDITPEKRASQLAFLQRQLCREPPAWSQKDADLSGKTAIVTGSNTGLGFECSAQLLDLGLSRLIIAVRSESKGEEAKQLLLKHQNTGHFPVIEVWKLDLSSYDSIVAFAERAKMLERLDIVVHNAGLLNKTYKQNTFTGHEEMVQVNYLSLALLTLLLLPTLEEKNTAAQPAHLVIVSSDTAAWAEFKERTSVPLLAGLDKPQSFKDRNQYATSKLLGQLFLSQLVKRVPLSSTIINAPNPGLCKSSLSRDYNNLFDRALVSTFHHLLGRKTDIGARAFTDAAVKQGPESHGQYLEDGKVQPMAPLVYKPEGQTIAERLWKETLDELASAKVADVVRSLGGQP